MTDKKMEIKWNRGGGIDLIIERDADNPIMILMGNPKASMEDFRRLNSLCETALDELYTKQVEEEGHVEPP